MSLKQQEALLKSNIPRSVGQKPQDKRLKCNNAPFF